VNVTVLGTLPDQNIAGPHSVEADGTIALGPAYGTIKVAGLTLDEAGEAIKKQLKGVLTAPEVSVSLAESAGHQDIAGEHLIGPDGTVNLGSYGIVYVAGMTIPEVRQAIEKHLEQFLDKPRISVDIFAYNSKFYFIVSEREGMDNVVRVPCTGHERVLDALSHDPNLRLSTTGWVWIARTKSDQEKPTILPVDWRALLRGESNQTNYWIEPGDRVFVQEK
jgi:polysaccharide export outer membrane protein